MKDLIRPTAAILAVCALVGLAVAAFGQATRPAANDRLLYLRADGTYVELQPADTRWPIVNRDVSAATLTRADGSRGEWVAGPTGVGGADGSAKSQAGGAGSQPATLPATPPADAGSHPPLVIDPPPPAGPPAPPPGIHVLPGDRWSDAVAAAAPGDTVWLAAGGTWSDALTDPNLRLKDVTIAAYDPGDGVTGSSGGGVAGSTQPPTIRVPKGSALVLYKASNVTLRGVRFTSEQTTGSGLRFFACTGVTLDRVAVSNFTFGVTCEGFRGDRSRDLKLLDCDISHNFNPAGQDSSGVFVSQTDGITIKGGRYDHNGWREGHNPGPSRQRNHNAYIAGDCTGLTVTGATIANACSHGLQARCGGVIEGNTFVDNPIHLSFGLVNGGGPITPGGVTGRIHANRFIGGRPLGGDTGKLEPRDWAIEVGNTRNAEITDNVFASDRPRNAHAAQAAIKLDVCNLAAGHPQAAKVIKIGTLKFIDNRCTWPGGPLLVQAKVDDQAAKATWQTVWPAVDVAAVRKAPQ